MIDDNALTIGLSKVLPPEDHNKIPMLIQVLEETLANTKQSTDTPIKVPSDIAQILEKLVGSKVNLGEGFLSFGKENQIGDIGLHDVAAGNIIYNITVHNNEKPIHTRLTAEEPTATKQHIITFPLFLVVVAFIIIIGIIGISIWNIAERQTIDSLMPTVNALTSQVNQTRTRFFNPREVTFYDFEEDPELASWRATKVSSVSRTNVRAFTGNYSLEVSTKGSQEGETGNIFIEWDNAFQADVIVGQVYWPRQQGVQVTWAQVCVTGWGYCKTISVEPGRWNSFVIDFVGLETEEYSPSKDSFPGLFFQAGINLNNSIDTYKFYMDSVQVMPAQNP